MAEELTGVQTFKEQADAIYRECAGEQFSPRPAYRKETDSLLFFMSDELSFQKRVNRLLTVWISDASGDVVGVKIKGFRRAIENMRRFENDWIVHQHPSLGFWLGIAVNTPDDGEGWIDYKLPGIERYSGVDIPKEYFEYV